VILDIIGLVRTCSVQVVQISSVLYSTLLLGFNLHFGALQCVKTASNDLAEAVRTMFAFDYVDAMFLLQLFFPPARLIVRLLFHISLVRVTLY